MKSCFSYTASYLNIRLINGGPSNSNNARKHCGSGSGNRPCHGKQEHWKTGHKKSGNPWTVASVQAMHHMQSCSLMGSDLSVKSFLPSLRLGRLESQFVVSIERKNKTKSKKQQLLSSEISFYILLGQAS